MKLRPRQRRRGALVVEAAFAYPVFFLMVLGMIVLGFGVFRYQEVAWLARDAARFASTHGGKYYSENAAAITAGTLPDVDKDYIIKSQIAQGVALGKGVQVNSGVVTLDPNLSVTIKITTAQGTFDWDATTSNYRRSPTSIDTTTNTAYQNYVTVTVSYKWHPEAVVAMSLSQPITLTSTSQMPMSY